MSNSRVKTENSFSCPTREIYDAFIKLYANNETPEQTAGLKVNHFEAIRCQRELPEQADASSVRAVSYTHLDVYKRQIRRLANNVCLQ